MKLNNTVLLGHGGYGKLSNGSGCEEIGLAMVSGNKFLNIQ
jgi:hypothetical protein